jgi:hypothetical protein
MGEGVVHLTIEPLGDWYYYTACGTYAAYDWVTCKNENVTCEDCVSTNKSSDREEC